MSVANLKISLCTTTRYRNYIQGYSDTCNILPVSGIRDVAVGKEISPAPTARSQIISYLLSFNLCELAFECNSLMSMLRVLVILTYSNMPL